MAAMACRQRAIPHTLDPNDSTFIAFAQPVPACRICIR